MTVKEILDHWIKGYENGSQSEHYTVLQASQDIETLIAEAYKKGYIDGGITTLVDK